MSKSKVAIALISTTIIGSVIAWALSLLSVGLAISFSVLVLGTQITVVYWRLRKALATTAKRLDKILTSVEAASNRSSISESNIVKAITNSANRQMAPQANRTELSKELGLMNGTINSVARQMNEIAIVMDFNHEPNRRL